MAPPARRTALAAFVIAIAWGSLTVRVAAHPLQFSFVDLSLTATRLDAAITVHAFDAAHDLGLATEDQVFERDFVTRQGSRLMMIVIARLAILADSDDIRLAPIDVTVVPDQRAVVLRVETTFARPVSRLHVSGVLFPYDPVHQTFVRLFEGGAIRQQAILTGSRPRADFVAGHTQGRFAVFQRFVRSGIEHIAIGPDHVLFLVGLLLVGGGLWPLVRIVTAFTLAHSITLSLAALDIVTPSARLVEPAIALSICYVGVDNLVRRPESRDRRAWIALVFGLVHGFGFASVLREMELPGHLLGWSLFAFNVGVEIGQLVIVVVVAAALAWVRRIWPAAGRWIVLGGSMAVIWAGFFWFVERTFFV
jgi:hydrogenase/urease accessory protein HupE